MLPGDVRLSPGRCPSMSAQASPEDDTSESDRTVQSRDGDRQKGCTSGIRQRRPPSTASPVAMIFPYSIRRITGVGSVVASISRDLSTRGLRSAWIVPGGSDPVIVKPSTATKVIEL